MMVGADVRQLRRYRRARPVHPEGGKSRLLCTLDVQPKVIADIGDLVGGKSQRITGGMKDCRIGFGGAQLVRCDIHLEVPGQSDGGQICGAIGQGADADAL